MKTVVFTMFLIGWDTRNHQFFQSGIIKNRARNPHMLFDTSNRIKYEKVSQQCPNGAPRNHQKSSKIHLGTLKGLPECTLAPHDHQIEAKVVPQDPKMLQKWSPKTSKNQ